MKALILVDIQNDFTPAFDGKPVGALAVPDGQAVIDVANRLMPNYELVVATQDWHPANHKSFASQHEGGIIGDIKDLNGLPQILWPDHCIQGTFGAAFCKDLNTDAIDEVVVKGTDPEIDSYSGFFDNGHRKATRLETLLKERGVTAIHVMGLATDYCVKFTALDAAELGFDTTLLLAGSRGVDLNEGDCEKAVEQMKAANVKIDTHTGT